MENNPQNDVIDGLVESMIPGLKEAIQQVFAGAGVVSFDCLQGMQNETGLTMSFRCFLTQELPGIVLQSTVDGLGKSLLHDDLVEHVLAKDLSRSLRVREGGSGRHIRLDVSDGLQAGFVSTHLLPL